MELISKTWDAVDEDILASVVDGNLKAFEVLVLRYEKPIVSFLYRLIGDYARAEELAQETFLRVFRAATGFSRRYKFSTWIYTIARNLARNELRYRSRHPGEASNEPVAGSVPVLRVLGGATGPNRPDEDVVSQELATSVQQALGRLSEKHRVALILSEYEAWSYEQIGQLLGRPRGTIKSWIYRAKRALIKELKDQKVFE